MTCGFLLGADTLKAAKRFPQTKFATIDYGYGTKGAKNLRGLVFAEQESGLPRRRRRGLRLEVQHGQLRRRPGGPAVVKFRAGYIAGAKATKKGIKVRPGYSESFTDQAKCKEMALNQMAAGSDVVFAAAGSAASARSEGGQGAKGKWGIGVDSDQAFLGTHILTSAVKRVDVAVFRAIRDVENGSFKAGDTLFNVKNGGVTYGKISSKYSRQPRCEPS